MRSDAEIKENKSKKIWKMINYNNLRKSEKVRPQKRNLKDENNLNMAAEKVLKKGSIVAIQSVSPRSGVKDNF